MNKFFKFQIFYIAILLNFTFISAENLLTGNFLTGSQLTGDQLMTGNQIEENTVISDELDLFNEFENFPEDTVKLNLLPDKKYNFLAQDINCVNQKLEIIGKAQIEKIQRKLFLAGCELIISGIDFKDINGSFIESKGNNKITILNSNFNGNVDEFIPNLINLNNNDSLNIDNTNFTNFFNIINTNGNVKDINMDNSNINANFLLNQGYIGQIKLVNNKIIASDYFIKFDNNSQTISNILIDNNKISANFIIANQKRGLILIINNSIIKWNNYLLLRLDNPELLEMRVQKSLLISFQEPISNNNSNFIQKISDSTLSNISEIGGSLKMSNDVLANIGMINLGGESYLENSLIYIFSNGMKDILGNGKISNSQVINYQLTNNLNLNNILILEIGENNLTTKYFSKGIAKEMFKFEDKNNITFDSQLDGVITDLEFQNQLIKNINYLKPQNSQLGITSWNIGYYIANSNLTLNTKNNENNNENQINKSNNYIITPENESNFKGKSAFYTGEILSPAHFDYVANLIKNFDKKTTTINKLAQHLVFIKQEIFSLQSIYFSQTEYLDMVQEYKKLLENNKKIELINILQDMQDNYLKFLKQSKKIMQSDNVDLHEVKMQVSGNVLANNNLASVTGQIGTGSNIEIMIPAGEKYILDKPIKCQKQKLNILGNQSLIELNANIELTGCKVNLSGLIITGTQEIKNLIKSNGENEIDINNSKLSAFSMIFNILGENDTINLNNVYIDKVSSVFFVSLGDIERKVKLIRINNSIIKNVLISTKGGLIEKLEILNSNIISRKSIINLMYKSARGSLGELLIDKSILKFTNLFENLSKSFPVNISNSQIVILSGIVADKDFLLDYNFTNSYLEGNFTRIFGKITIKDSFLNNFSMLEGIKIIQNSVLSDVILSLDESAVIENSLIYSLKAMFNIFGYGGTIIHSQIINGSIIDTITKQYNLEIEYEPFKFVKIFNINNKIKEENKTLVLNIDDILKDPNQIENLKYNSKSLILSGGEYGIQRSIGFVKMYEMPKLLFIGNNQPENIKVSTGSQNIRTGSIQTTLNTGVNNISVGTGTSTKAIETGANNNIIKGTGGNDNNTKKVKKNKVNTNIQSDTNSNWINDYLIYIICGSVLILFKLYLRKKKDKVGFDKVEFEEEVKEMVDDMENKKLLDINDEDIKNEEDVLSEEELQQQLQDDDKEEKNQEKKEDLKEKLLKEEIKLDMNIPEKTEEVKEEEIKLDMNIPEKKEEVKEDEIKLDMNIPEKKEEIKEEEIKLDMNIPEKKEEVKEEEIKLDMNIPEKKEEVKEEEIKLDMNIPEKKEEVKEDEIKLDMNIPEKKEEVKEDEIKLDMNIPEKKEEIKEEEIKFDMNIPEKKEEIKEEEIKFDMNIPEKKEEIKEEEIKFDMNIQEKTEEIKNNEMDINFDQLTKLTEEPNLDIGDINSISETTEKKDNTENLNFDMNSEPEKKENISMNFEINFDFDDEKKK